VTKDAAAAESAAAHAAARANYSLTVTELEARGLPNTDVKGGADPYVVFHHGDSELVRTEDLKDAFKGRHVDVVRWPNSYTCHVSSLQSSRLAISVTVYDRGSEAGGDVTSTLLGRGTFEIELVPNARKLEKQLSVLLKDVPKGAAGGLGAAQFSSSVSYYPLRWRRAAASINLTLSMTHLEPPPSLSPPALRRGGARGHGPLSLREIDPAAAAEGSIFLGADAHSEEGMPGDGATRQPAEGWDAATKSQSPVGASRAVASLTRRLTHTGSRRVGLASPKAGGVVRV
jgi:hypothetical protein